MLKKKSTYKFRESNSLAFLKEIDIFAEFEEDTLRRISEFATVLNFQDGETILLAGDIRRALFFVVRGQAKVLSDGKNFRETILNILGIGDFFGEIPLFRKEGKTNLSVKAEGECSVLIFKGKDFLRELEENPCLSHSFMAAMAQNLSKTYTKLTALSVNTIRGRIVYCLMQFIEELGVRSKDKSGNQITILRNRPTQLQLGEMSGTSRETVNRELSNLVRQGVIELNGKDLILKKELKI
ncbi:cyclic AMP receptor-like protein [Fibrobacterales bacterium]|nr:cyclic AMP receptor-like protein [Fibrobacterales bacterium]